jgi:hypothetical protein
MFRAFLGNNRRYSARLRLRGGEGGIRTLGTVLELLKPRRVRKLQIPKTRQRILLRRALCKLGFSPVSIRLSIDPEGRILGDSVAEGGHLLHRSKRLKLVSMTDFLATAKNVCISPVETETLNHSNQLKGRCAGKVARDRSLLHSDHDDGLKLQPFRTVQLHEIDLIGLLPWLPNVSTVYSASFPLGLLASSSSSKTSCSSPRPGSSSMISLMAAFPAARSNFPKAIAPSSHFARIAETLPICIEFLNRLSCQP